MTTQDRVAAVNRKLRASAGRMTCPATIGSLHCVREDGHDSVELRLQDGAIIRKAAPHLARNGWTWKSSPYRGLGVGVGSPFFSWVLPEFVDGARHLPYGGGEHVAFARAMWKLGIPVTGSVELMSIDEEDEPADLTARRAALLNSGSPIIQRHPDGGCNCEFTVQPGDEDEGTPETAWHYFRLCPNCGHDWWALHCPHDGSQNPCGACGVVPEVVRV